MSLCHVFFFFNDTATTEIYTLSLHDALPICHEAGQEIRGSRGDQARHAEDLLHGLQPGVLREARQRALIGLARHDLTELELHLAVSSPAGPRHDRAQLRIALQRFQDKRFALQARIGDRATLAEVAWRVVRSEQQDVEPAVPYVVTALADGGRDGSIVLQNQEAPMADRSGQIAIETRRGQELAELALHT